MLYTREGFKQMLHYTEIKLEFTKSGQQGAYGDTVSEAQIYMVVGNDYAEHVIKLTEEKVRAICALNGPKWYEEGEGNPFSPRLDLLVEDEDTKIWTVRTRERYND